MGCGDILAGVSPPGRSACRFPKSYCDFPENPRLQLPQQPHPYSRNVVEDWLTIFDLIRHLASILVRARGRISQNRVAMRIADGEFLDYLNACARLRTQRVKVELLVELSPL
jgi:hypothetical protein